MIDATKLVIEGAIDRALRQIAMDSRRGLRNLVDLGLLFNKSGWRQFFLRSAQNMLSDDNSAYYELARRLQSTVDNSRLKTFGIALGYESCTKGAKRIREIEQSHGFDIPWALTILAGSEGVSQDAADRLIAQGKNLGVHAFALIDQGLDMEALRRTLEEHQDCAFLLMLQGGKKQVQKLEVLEEYQNFIVSIDAGQEDAMEKTEWLQSRRFLYGVHTFYNDNTASQVIDPESLDRYLQYAPAAVFLLAEAGTKVETLRRTAENVVAIRKTPNYAYLLFEALYDVMYLDNIISQDDCAMAITKDGKAVCLRSGGSWSSGCSIYENSLEQILRRTASKGGSHG
ncbi:MAG: hypothetical protein HFG44_07805 [Oscillospiraceae bacterium]|nr:hypothetical protein [Oscillospiraceae bacterium]